jgi:8-oxo-dGTP pyrophosphatase MutT (NUDIX family)
VKHIGLFIGRILFWLGWPAYWLYYWRGYGRTRVLLVSGKDILVLKGWINDGLFILPGGGLHKNEDPLAGAVRETFEETGLRLLPETMQYLGRATYRKAGLEFVYHMFLAPADATTQLKRQRHEVADIRWIPVANPEGLGLSQEIVRAVAAAQAQHLLQ